MDLTDCFIEYLKATQNYIREEDSKSSYWKDVDRAKENMQEKQDDYLAALRKELGLKECGNE